MQHVIFIDAQLSKWLTELLSKRMNKIEKIRVINLNLELV